MSTKTRETMADRMKEDGLPYHLTDVGQMWSVLVAPGGPFVVVAFTDYSIMHEGGVYVGYHTDEERAKEAGRKALRRRHINASVVLPVDSVVNL